MRPKNRVDGYSRLDGMGYISMDFSSIEKNHVMQGIRTKKPFYFEKE
jgi:hypothetical protein